PDGGEGARRPAWPLDDHEEHVGGGHLGGQRRVDRDDPRDRAGGFLAAMEETLPGCNAGQQDDPQEEQRYEVLLGHDSSGDIAARLLPRPPKGTQYYPATCRRGLMRATSI